MFDYKCVNFYFKLMQTVSQCCWKIRCKFVILLLIILKLQFVSKVCAYCVAFHNAIAINIVFVFQEPCVKIVMCVVLCV